LGYAEVGSDVADEPGTEAEYARLEPGALQPGLDRRGGAELLVAEFRVHVQVAAEGDEFGAQLLRQGAGQGTAVGVIGLGLGRHQLLHPLKGRTPRRPTDPRS